MPPKYGLGYTTPKERRSGGEPLAKLCQFDRPGICNPDLPQKDRRSGGEPLAKLCQFD